LNEARAHQSNPAEADPDQVFDTPEDRKVLDGILARIIRSSSQESVPPPPIAEDNEPEAIRPSDESGE
jgi:hypothetical protein